MSQKKVSIIYPFWIRRKPLQILFLPTLPPKPQPLANWKKDRKRVGKEQKSVPTAYNASVYYTGEGGGGLDWRKGEGWMRLLYTLPLHEPHDKKGVWQYAKRSIFWWTLRKRESWLTTIWTQGVAENLMMSRRSKREMLTDPQQPSPPPP